MIVCYSEAESLHWHGDGEALLSLNGTSMRLEDMRTARFQVQSQLQLKLTLHMAQLMPVAFNDLTKLAHRDTAVLALSGLKGDSEILRVPARARVTHPLDPPAFGSGSGCSDSEYYPEHPDPEPNAGVQITQAGTRTVDTIC